MLLFALPVALLAGSFDERVGIAAAFFSLALIWLWTELRDVHVTSFSYVSRGATFVALGGLLGRFARVTRATQRALEHMAQHDSLTGLFNRRRFEEELARSHDQAKRYDSVVAVLLLDLDDFKQVNDSFGHQVGDEVLRQVGVAFRDELRASDIAARLGGDEFAALLPSTDLPAAGAVARKLKTRLAEIPAFMGASELAVSASIGVVPLSSSDRSGDEALARADRAMYEAKRARV
ncbi:MAG: GGDEF domain-containing protein [Thermoleophilaceae bacterium]